MKPANVAIIVVLAILVAGGGGFYGGITYQKGKQPSDRGGMARSGNFPANMNFNGSGRNGMGGGVRGEVTSVDGSTITIKQTDGSSKIVVLGSSTSVTNTVDASTSDITVGKTVMIVGTSNSDGSVTATSVQLNPSTSSIPGGQPPSDQAAQ